MFYNLTLTIIQPVKYLKRTVKTIIDFYNKYLSR